MSVTPRTLAGLDPPDRQAMEHAFAYADMTWPGWEHVLLPEQIIMSDSCNCVAGQLERAQRGLPTTCYAYYLDLQVIDSEAAEAVNDAFLEGGSYVGNLTRRNVGRITVSPFASSHALDYWAGEQQRRLQLLEKTPAPY